MKLPRTMRAVRAETFGDPAVLQPVDVGVPEPGEGQVLLRVESAAVNFSDVMRRRGSTHYPFPTALPYVPGSEVAGTVAALGPGGEGPAVGTPVFAVVGQGGEGGYAQFAVAGAAQTIPRPDPLAADAAAGLLVAGTTAVLLLEQVARLQKGETVYVPAAAGGVGSLLVQLGKHLGARVVAGASTEAKRARATELGADVTVDTRRDVSVALRDHVEPGVDVLLVMAGGDRLDRGLSALAPFGRAIVYGSASDEAHRLSDASLDRWLSAPALNGSVTAFNLGAYFGLRPQLAQEAVGRLIGLVLEGVIRIPIDHRFRLDEAAAAHSLLESRASTGKLILRPWD